MKEQSLVTDADLNRYIDGEMDEADRRIVERFLSQDPSLTARLGAYRKVDETIRDAFDSLEPPIDCIEKGAVPVKRRTLAAASLLLPVGVLVGWIGHSVWTQPTVYEPQISAINTPVQGQERRNTIFHIEMDDKLKMGKLLDRAESILAANAKENVQVEVVANGAGLNLLRADTSAFAPRIHEMMDKYDNLTFIACANTIKRLQEKGVKVLLIERTHARDTAVDHIVDRLRGGWTYIKI